MAGNGVNHISAVKRTCVCVLGSGVLALFSCSKSPDVRQEVEALVRMLNLSVRHQLCASVHIKLEADQTRSGQTLPEPETSQGRTHGEKNPGEPNRPVLAHRQVCDVSYVISQGQHYGVKWCR